MKKILIAILLSCTCFLCSCFASTFSSGQDGESSASIEQSEGSSQLVEDEQDSSSVQAEDNSSEQSEGSSQLVEDERDSSSVQTEDNSSSSLAENSSSTVDTQTTLLTAYFDYGLHVDNRATLLLGGCLLFFDLESYGIDRINAGDVIEIVYRGELYVLETYPSTVVTDYMEIVSIRIIKTNIVVVEVMLESDGEVIVATKGDDKFIFDSQGLYVVNQDGTYTSLEEQESGTTLYATLEQGEEAEIAALYSYAPVAVEPHTCAPICDVVKEATCQEAGKERIICTYCSYVFEENELPIVDCVYDGGVCKWCGEQEKILLPCCICGSYTCNGHE